jgi:hypothetical protein
LRSRRFVGSGQDAALASDCEQGFLCHWKRSFAGLEGDWFPRRVSKKEFPGFPRNQNQRSCAKLNLGITWKREMNFVRCKEHKRREISAFEKIFLNFLFFIRRINR